jgi:hypothetical protein
MKNIISTTFIGLWMVRNGQTWRLVFGAAVYDTYGDTRSLKYALNGRVYECKNVYCFQRLANDATRFTQEQFDSYLGYVIERNYRDVRNIGWKQSLEEKVNAQIPMKNAELQNLLSLRASEQNIQDEMNQDITGTTGLTYFKCLIQ